MPSTVSSTFESCLQEAMDLTRHWVPAWLDHLLTQLRERETLAGHVHERQALADACLVLQRQREPIARHWLSGLADEMEEAPSVLAGLSRRTPLSLDELELMGDDQVNQKVEIARVQQVIGQVVDDRFTEFTARLSTAQGLEVVSPDLNPLRPAIYIETLMAAFEALQIAPGVRSRWLQAGSGTLGRSLDTMYRRLTQSLEAQGVKPAGYVVVTAPESRNFTGVAAGTDLLGDDLTEGEVLLTLDHLHQLLVGGSEGARGERSRPASADPMMRAMASEVVTLMLKRISTDQRLLPPVRQVLQDMKPALLELASRDPRFFADRNNPARRVLDAITARSLAFASERDPGFNPFERDLRRMVGDLKKPGVDLAERFPQLLDDLQRSQAHAASGEAEARGRALQTLVKVEQRNLLAEKVAGEFRARSDYKKSPGPVRRFLTSVWAQVVAHARLKEVDQPALLSGDTDAKRYNDILSDLLWSSQLAQASLNRPRLVKVIPPVLRTLRDGLDSIDYPREKAEAFFQTLMGLHEAAYKTQRVEPKAPVDPDISQLNQEDADLWMQRQEAQDTNLFDSLPEPTQPAFMNTLPQPHQREWSEVKAEMALRDATSMVVGSWFDLWQEGQSLRVQLTWASPHGTLFLFGTASGRSMSMTRRGVDRLIEQDRLRVVADHSVVDEALDAVAQQALRNSSKA